MLKLMTHPDNWELIKSQFEEYTDNHLHILRAIEVVTSELLPRTRKTGKYIQCDGKVVTKEEIHIEEKFWIWGPQHLKVLLWWGLVKEEEELYCCLVNEDDYARKSFSF